jgi:SpoIID/LytB domain protein
MSTRRSFLAALLGGLFAGRAQAQESDAGLFAGAPAPDDPLELLYSRRLSFDEGQPLITVRVVEGRKSVVVEPDGPLTVETRGKGGHLRPALEGGGAGRWTITLTEGTPGAGAAYVELEQLRLADKDGLAHARETWKARGVPVKVVTVGEAYGIAGHVVDTRRYAVLADGDGTETSARQQARELETKYGVRTQLHRELTVRPRGTIELRNPVGAVAATGDTALELRAGKGIAVDEVEFGMGYANHGFEKRTYPGRLFATVDASGALALVAAVPMERLVEGVVPSEIFPDAHREALKAQAVTARGEVLAKIGARHLGDPYLLCAEQHCQVYKGTAAEQAGPTAAVEATRGEALFDGRGRLVDSVYSAVCGGFTEDNDAVWGGPPDPSLRGRPDFAGGARVLAPFRNGIGARLVARLVHIAKPPTYCAAAARPDKVRWTRTFTQREVDAICAPLGTGPVRSMAVEGRGVSGRAKALRIDGTKATARVHGELAVRRLFRNLNSGMFVIGKAGSAWVFRGGGWGHGSGMCQAGAIGRAKAGATYAEILGWYYSGAAPTKVY